MKRTHAVLVIAAAALLGVLAARPAASEADDAAIGKELAGIRAALERLAASNEANRRYQDVDVVLKRIELWVKRLEPLEGELGVAQDELRQEETALDSLERMRAQQEARLAEEIRQNTDTPRSDTRQVLEDIERSRIGIEERMKADRMRIQQYENDLVAGRKQIELLDERLAELLGED